MSMLGVLTLAMCEKLLNSVIATDNYTQEGLSALSGKTLRINMHAPAISIDVLFGDGRVRFEPVASAIFEPQGGISTMPDCTLSVDNLAHLLSLIQNPVGNLPIRGDHQVLLQAKSLFEGFEPDIWYQLEQIIGTDATSHLYLLGKEISPVLSPIGELIKQSAAQLLSSRTPSARSIDDELLDLQIQDKKQELLRLQADIERSQARLAQLQSSLDDQTNA